MKSSCLIGALIMMIFASHTSAQSPEEKLPFKGTKFHLETDTKAAKWLEANKNTSESAATLKAIEYLSKVPVGRWLDGNGDSHALVKKVAEDSLRESTAGVIVSYNLPDRDLGGESAGGVNSTKAYFDWVDSTVDGVSALREQRIENGHKIACIIEPDSTGHFKDMADESAKLTRIQSVNYCVQTWAREPLVYTYLDAAHPAWFNPDNQDDMKKLVDILGLLGVQHARGVSINVSNFQTYERCCEYGEKIVKLLEKRGYGRKFYVVDTSRNGKGPAPDNAWLNPPGRGLGRLPSGNGDNRYPHLDATLWIKVPGESDGKGGASALQAGAFDPKLAAEMYQNRSVSKK